MLVLVAVPDGKNLVAGGVGHDAGGICPLQRTRDIALAVTMPGHVIDYPSANRDAVDLPVKHRSVFSHGVQLVSAGGCFGTAE